MKIFVAGATGVVGLPLVRALRTLGHDVTGMTRAGAGVDRLRELGAHATFADAFDRGAVLAAMRKAAPEAVIDQLTWLPADPADLMRSMPDDTRLHREGGGNLLAAARELGVGRYLVQSRGFFRRGHEVGPLREDERVVASNLVTFRCDHDTAFRHAAAFVASDLLRGVSLPPS